jgi:hypothetical protein
MKISTTRTTAIAATLIAVTLSVVGCSKDDSSSSSKDTTSAASSSAKTSSEKTSSAKSSKPKASPRTTDSAKPGTNKTIADYIASNNIKETPVKQGDAGAPTIDLPVPDGWEVAGEDAPDYAYGAIVYTGAEAADYVPSVIAILSKLEGDNVNAKDLLAVAEGELKNLPGYKELGPGENVTLSDFPAYDYAGLFTDEGQSKVVAQKTVVITGADGSLYVLQLNADGLESQAEIVGAALTAIDEQTKITP